MYMSNVLMMDTSHHICNYKEHFRGRFSVMQKIIILVYPNVHPHAHALSPNPHAHMSISPIDRLDRHLDRQCK